MSALIRFLFVTVVNSALICFGIIINSLKRLNMPLAGYRNHGIYCAAINCSSCQGKVQAWKEQLCEVHGLLMGQCCKQCQPYQLHRFPKDKELSSKWVHNLRRDGFQHNNSSRLCSLHFVDGKPTKENPCPELLLGYEKKVYPKRRAPVVRAPLAVKRPRVSSDSIPQDQEVTERSAEAASQTNFIFSVNCKCQVESEHSYLKSSARNAGTQAKVRDFSVLALKPEQLKFYTGINKELFSSIASVFALKIGSYGRSYLTAEDQLLLILTRNRLNLLMQDLAFRFDISLSCCSKIFSEGIAVLSSILRNAVFWLPSERIKATMPEQFVELYPDTSCIIDCSEVMTEKPEGLMARAKLYSNYKANNTLKYLVATSPAGFIMFVSPAYGGRASDKFICQDSGFYDYLRPGDQVMGDRGFDIEPELGLQGVHLNIPAFTRGRKLSEWDCTRTRRIASIRIHIERVIGRMKNFRILKSTIPLSTIRNIDHVLIVCAALTNLKQSIIKSKSVMS